MSVQFQKHYFNVHEYHRMAEVGLLSEDSRVELIEGEIIEMSPIGSTHGGTVNRSSKLLHRKLDDIAIISVQNPVHIDDFSEPQPDLALLKPRKDFYSRSHPTPADVLVVIEVADTSVEYDRNVKPAALCTRGDTGSLVDGSTEGRHRSSLAPKEREVPKSTTAEAR